MRRTYSLVQVATALMANGSGRHWGYQLSRESGVRSGVMYPTLQRMLDEGWLTDGWEDPPQSGRAKRPPRRYYDLTEEGRAALGAVVADARRDLRFAPLAAGHWRVRLSDLLAFTRAAGELAALFRQLGQVSWSEATSSLTASE